MCHTTVIVEVDEYEGAVPFVFSSDDAPQVVVMDWDKVDSFGDDGLPYLREQLQMIDDELTKVQRRDAQDRLVDIRRRIVASIEERES